MNCEHFREQIPECLAGQLDPGAREELIAHLETCSACRGELSELGAVWRGMQSIPVVEPEQAMRSRFLEVLEAYQAGVEAGKSQPVAMPGSKRQAPAGLWRLALAASLLLAGGIAGHFVAPQQRSSPEIARLTQQVDSLRQMMAVSLLQDETPTSRIRGISYGTQVIRPDREVVQSLLYALNHDTNVNVRLAAADALEKLAGNPEIRRALTDALPLQDSPLVQIALIDEIEQNGDRDALPALKKLVQSSETDESTRQRATAAVRKLEVHK